MRKPTPLILAITFVIVFFVGFAIHSAVYRVFDAYWSYFYPNEPDWIPLAMSYFTSFGVVFFIICAWLVMIKYYFELAEARRLARKKFRSQ